ncbi:MAG: SNF2 helicase associated domain-containing protein [Butyrivibrio sp.]|nr:SNF2 helicase associated domain-containing protein [Butyrivibrio sp.]
MNNGANETKKGEYITGSGRRFVSDAPKEFHYTSFETKRLLREYAPESEVPLLYRDTSLAVLEPHAVLSREKVVVSFCIRSEKGGHSYVLKDISELLDAIDKHSFLSYGKHLEFTHDMSAFSAESQKIINFLYDYFRGKRAGDPYQAYSRSRGRSKNIELSGNEIDEFFKSVKETFFLNSDFRAKYSEERLLEIVPVFPDIDLHIEKKNFGIVFESGSFTMFEGYSNIYFERKRKLHMIPRSDCSEIIPVLKFLAARRTENELFVAEKDLPLFSEGLFPVINEFFNVSTDGFEASRYAPDIPKFEIYLDMPDANTITCQVKAAYETESGMKESFDVFASSDSERFGDETATEVKRNYYLENRTAKLVSPYFDKLDTQKKELVLVTDSYTDDKLYVFLAEKTGYLSTIGDVFVSDAIKAVRIEKRLKVTLGVSVVSDFLELSMVPETLTPDELSEILSQYDKKRKYYKLKSGEVVNVSDDDAKMLFALKDGLGITAKQIIEGHASVPRYRALFINDVAEKNLEEGGASLGRSKGFKDFVSGFAAPTDKRFTIPESLEGILRDYQKTGFFWLKALSHNGFGGILADDMGLGKTIQILAFLLSVKECAEKEGRKNRCSLIVCPASLVYNWQHEIRKFTPSLNCEMAVGIKPDRVRVTSEIDSENTDVIITSYDLLRRDVELYKYLNFECCVIDEAQFIKNPGTLVAKAVKSINASFKVALTGTPIENRLSELWSIFDFCMPGYLFGYKQFHDNIEVPVVSEGDDASTDMLKKMISPFVLRRLKSDVLKDLPDKLEENIYAPMNSSQRELYDAHLQRVKLMVEGTDEESFGKDRIVILSEITRLRQLCCDPGLVYENYDGGSAKTDLLIEMIKSASESGHKILLFSQFTSMLERITKELTDAGISHYLLTGSTKKEDRIKLVDAFQEDDTSVFCISLKAGGTGLNLTSADIVIHFDHWWNIAVENQATDRAHRIGQKNVVTVYRLIMENTIEERIITLQNRKKELADKLLNTGSMSNPTLTKEELLELLG